MRLRGAERCAGLLALSIFLAVPAWAQTVTIDTVALTITGDGDGDPNAINGVPFTAQAAGGLAKFFIAGDLNLDPGETVVATGPNAVSLVVGNDVNIPAGATIDISAVGVTPGPGGGGGGPGGGGGAGGSGSGGGPGNPGGQGGSGGAGLVPAQPGSQGFDGGHGHARTYGGVGTDGTAGADGYNNPGSGAAPGAGGSFGGSIPGVFQENRGPGGPVTPPPVAGGFGGAGRNGETGLTGQAGASNGGTNPSVGTAIGGGGGGSGGGGGQGGGGGGGGQGGGGGGGGGGHLEPFLGVGGPGGNGGSGGAGGDGGPGGNGGAGGDGGAGGGAIEIVAEGRVVSGASFLANGGAGTFGPVGTSGTLGPPGQGGSPGSGGQAGFTGFPPIPCCPGGDGGPGGGGAFGGLGFSGALGARGGGGAGGSVKLAGTVVDLSGAGVQSLQGDDAFGGGGWFIVGSSLLVAPATSIALGFGAQETISSGGLLGGVRGAAIEADGNVLSASVETIVRIVPGTGAQSTLGAFSFVVDVAVEADGNILALDIFGGLFRVNPVSGASSTLTDGFVEPYGVTVEADGNILVTDPFGLGLVRVDPGTGVASVLTACCGLGFPIGVAVEADGNILVADFGGAIKRVNPATGAYTTVSTGGNLRNPWGIAVDVGGSILVSDVTFDGIIRVHPVTGAQTIVSPGGSLADPAAVLPQADGSLVVADFPASIIRLTLRQPTFFPVAGDPNPFLFSGAPTPNIPGLEGGAETYGVTGLAATDFPGVLAAAPLGAAAALLRVGYGPPGFDDDIPGFDLALFINLELFAGIDQPQVGFGSFSYFTDLLVGGFANDPLFGGSGPQTLATLDGLGVYATRIPDTATDFNMAMFDAGFTINNYAANLAVDQAIYLIRSGPIEDCEDGADNDGDGNTDYPDDRGCKVPRDPSELPDCSDGFDNDGDALIDFPADPGCRNAFIPTSREDPQCQDGEDNDDDTLIDYPADPQCAAAWGKKESGGGGGGCGLVGLEALAVLATLTMRRRRPSGARTPA